MAEINLELARLRMERRKVLEEYMGYCETVDSLRAESGVGPMLIITYKNRALDQFLIGISGTITTNIVRVGSRSKSPMMQQYNIRNVVGNFKGALHGKSKFDIGRRLSHLKELLKESTASMLSIEGESTPRLTAKVFLAEQDEFHVYGDQGGGPSLFQRSSLVDMAPAGIRDTFDGKESVEQLYLDLWLGHIKMEARDHDRVVFTRQSQPKDPANLIGGGSDLVTALGVRARRQAVGRGVVTAAPERKADGEDFEERLNKKAAKKKTLGVSEGFEKNQMERLNTDFVMFVNENTETQQRTGVSELREMVDLWTMSLPQRFQIAREWIIAYEKQRLKGLHKAYDEATEDFVELRNDSSLRALMSADVVGMTTTGCAQYPHLLEALSPSIVIVEESAEILEGQILPCLTSKTQHLVMIGDHKQLQPSVQVYPLEMQKNLHISLFERLTLNGFPVQTLGFQRRMHPLIAKCISTIYPKLQDHPWVLDRKFDPEKAAKTAADKLNLQLIEGMGGGDDKKSEEKEAKSNGITPKKRGALGGELPSSLGLWDDDDDDTSQHPGTPVKNTPGKANTPRNGKTTPFGSPATPNVFDIEGPSQVPGMQKNLYFWTHSQPESVSASGFSVANMHEVEMIRFLARYFLRLRIPPSAITVLATYQGQTRLLKETLDEMCNEMQVDKIEEIHTVDNYQGDENDIVLLSLVRSNDEGKIGFLNKPNRYCVALSRARHGLYVCGNLNFLADKSDYWNGLLCDMRIEGVASDHIPLVCPRHPHEVVLNVASDQRLTSQHLVPYWTSSSRGRSNHMVAECNTRCRNQHQQQLRSVAEHKANSIGISQQQIQPDNDDDLFQP